MAQQEVQNGGAHKAAICTSVKHLMVPKTCDVVQFFKTVFSAKEVGSTLHPEWKGDQELPIALFIELKASDVVLFYKIVFGAEEVSHTIHRTRNTDQELPLVIFIKLKLAEFTILVSDLPEDIPLCGFEKVICLETEDVSSAFAKAEKAGGITDGEVTEGQAKGLVRLRLAHLLSTGSLVALRRTLFSVT